MTPSGLSSTEYVREMEEQITQLRIQVRGQEERLNAEAMAREVALKALRSWQEAANEWRGTIGDLTLRFVSRETWDTEMRLIRSQHDQDRGKSIALSGVLALVLVVAGWAVNYFLK